MITRNYNSETLAALLWFFARFLIFFSCRDQFGNFSLILMRLTVFKNGRSICQYCGDCLIFWASALRQGPMYLNRSVRPSIHPSISLPVYLSVRPFITHFSQNPLISFSRYCLWGWRTIAAPKWKSPIFLENPNFS